MEQTFSIIKPDAVKRNLIGHINQIIEAAGLRDVMVDKDVIRFMSGAIPAPDLDQEPLATSSEHLPPF